MSPFIIRITSYHDLVVDDSVIVPLSAVSLQKAKLFTDP